MDFDLYLKQISDFKTNMSINLGLQFVLMNMIIFRGGYVFFREKNNITCGISFRKDFGKQKKFSIQIDSAILPNIKDEFNYSFGLSLSKKI